MVKNNLKTELQALKKSKKPSLLVKEVTNTLKVLASNGKTETTFGSGRYDQETIDFLRNEGLDVKEVSDFRDGDYILVKW